MESKTRSTKVGGKLQDDGGVAVGATPEPVARVASRRATPSAGGDRVKVVASSAKSAQEPTGRKRSSSTRPSQNLLLRALWSCMERRGHSIHDLADALDVTYGYLLSIARGERAVNTVSRDILMRAADYLQLPLAQVYVWAGVLAAEDFYNSRSLAYELDALYEDLRNNIGMNFFLPTKEEWDDLPARPKLTIAIMYEQLRGKTFLSHVEMAKAG